MKKAMMCLVGLVALCAVPVLAQSAGNDTLSALLTEVRLLRQALERNATAPQVQLLGTRLTVQNARLESAIRDHEAARVALQQTIGEIAALTSDLTAQEAAPARAATPERQAQLEQQRAMTKEQLIAVTGREPQLRAREAELAAAVTEEQNQWLLLNRRLDEIERALTR